MLQSALAQSTVPTLPTELDGMLPTSSVDFTQAG